MVSAAFRNVVSDLKMGRGRTEGARRDPALKLDGKLRRHRRAGNVKAAHLAGKFMPDALFNRFPLTCNVAARLVVKIHQQADTASVDGSKEKAPGDLLSAPHTDGILIAAARAGTVAAAHGNAAGAKAAQAKRVIGDGAFQRKVFGCAAALLLPAGVIYQAVHIVSPLFMASQRFLLIPTTNL